MTPSKTTKTITETWKLTDADLRRAIAEFVVKGRTDVDPGTIDVKISPDCSWGAEGKDMYYATVIVVREEDCT